MLWFSFVLVTLVVCYFAFARPVLRKLPATAAFYARVDAVEAAILVRCRGAFAFARRAVVAIGAVGASAVELLPPDALQSLHDVDWTALVSATRAAQIAGILMVAIAVLHVVGLIRAAAAPRA